MGTKERKHTAPPRYDEAFKAGAVRMVTEQGRPSREVAAELGICIDTLRSWLKAAGAPSPGQTDRQNRDAKRLRELEADGLVARREYGRLIFTHDGPPAPLAPFSPAEGENPVPGTPWVLKLDGPPWPGLTVRPRRPGDVITLPGRPPKKLKELFIDEKLPRRYRDNLPLCADEEGLLALAGFGPNLAHPRHRRVEFIKQEQENGNEG